MGIKRGRGRFCGAHKRVGCFHQNNENNSGVVRANLCLFGWEGVLGRCVVPFKELTDQGGLMLGNLIFACI